VERVLALQRQLGNAAVGRLLGAAAAAAGGLYGAAQLAQAAGLVPKTHHYDKSFVMGTYPRRAFPTAAVVAPVFKRDFLCTSIKPVGQETVLTPSLPLLGSNHVKNIGETTTPDEWRATLETVPGKHILKGTAEQRITLVPVGEDQVQVVWAVTGDGPQEGESAAQQAVQAVGAFGVFDVWQRWRFKANLDAHAARVAKETDPGHT
jgi:hypothetical protein